jgi:3-hydroxyethyl bacteriochlorophyllide a dehydrogenase
VAPEDDRKTDYKSIYDASGSTDVLAQLIGRLSKGGEIVLAGFYTDPISFAFPPAFMKEAKFRVAAEWDRDDLTATRALVESGALSLGGLITHSSSSADAPGAYETAFQDSSCLKMMLNWEKTS